MFGGFAFAALLGFQHEAAGTKQVDAAKADAAIAVVEFHGLFEDVRFEAASGRVGSGCGTLAGTLLFQEGLRVGEFRAARIFPTLNKRFRCHLGPKTVTLLRRFDRPQVLKTTEGIA